MRIISGNRRGHKLAGFSGGKIRPTTDRVKESVFNLIQGFVADSSVLDLFAGSGALGFEALSRGASRAVFVDSDREAVGIVKKNAEALGFCGLVKIFNKPYQEFFKNSKESFDIIFLDPPYNKGFILPVLTDIVKNSRLADGGIIVLESDETDLHSEFEGLAVLKQKKYGRSYITIYQRR